MKGCKRLPFRKLENDEIPILADSYYLLLYLAQKNDVRLKTFYKIQLTIRVPETLVFGKTYEMTYITNETLQMNELPLLRIKKIKDKDENLQDVFETWANMNLGRANCIFQVLLSLQKFKLSYQLLYQSTSSLITILCLWTFLQYQLSTATMKSFPKVFFSLYNIRALYNAEIHSLERHNSIHTQSYHKLTLRKQITLVQFLCTHISDQN